MATTENSTVIRDESRFYRQLSGLAVSQGDAEVLYQTGLYWLKEGDTKKAEQWLRYAARQGHHEAMGALRVGVRDGIFRDEEHYFISLAIDFFENLMTPAPSQKAIDELSGMLKSYWYRDLVAE